jgi:hypothetical protein
LYKADLNFLLQEKQALREEMLLAFEGAVGQLSAAEIKRDSCLVECEVLKDVMRNDKIDQVNINVHVYIHIYVYLYTYMCIFMYACLYLCTYMYI